MDSTLEAARARVGEFVGEFGVDAGNFPEAVIQESRNDDGNGTSFQCFEQCVKPKNLTLISRGATLPYPFAGFTMSFRALQSMSERLFWILPTR